VTRSEVFVHIIDIIKSYDPLDGIPMDSRAWNDSDSSEREVSEYVRSIVDEVMYSKDKIMGIETEH
jgi:hypothetical protein